MTFDSFSVIFYATTFLVPGFICSAVVSMLVPRRPQAMEVRALEFLTPSCLNYGIWSWAVFLVFRLRVHEKSPYLTAAVLAVIVFVSPFVLGLVLGGSSQQRWTARFLRRFGFRTIHSVPTAWDYHFSRLITQVINY